MYNWNEYIMKNNDHLTCFLDGEQELCISLFFTTRKITGFTDEIQALDQNVFAAHAMDIT